MTEEEEEELRKEFAELTKDQDKFRYELVVARTFQDALIAIIFNSYIQSCVIRYGFPYKSNHDLSSIKNFIAHLDKVNCEKVLESEMGPNCGKVFKRFQARTGFVSCN